MTQEQEKQCVGFIDICRAEAIKAIEDEIERSVQISPELVVAYLDENGDDGFGQLINDVLRDYVE